LDIDDLDLFSKLKVLKEILKEVNTPIEVLNYIKGSNSFSNVCALLIEYY